MILQSIGLILVYYLWDFKITVKGYKNYWVAYYLTLLIKFIAIFLLLIVLKSLNLIK